MTESLFSAGGRLVPLLVGMALMLYAAAQAVRQRKDPRRLILWGALHDAGIVCLGLGAATAIGATGPTVKTLQRLINLRTGTSLAIDGSFGTSTQNAVRQFQAINHLTVDGKAGDQTWADLPEERRQDFRRLAQQVADLVAGK